MKKKSVGLMIVTVDLEGQSLYKFTVQILHREIKSFLCVIINQITPVFFFKKKNLKKKNNHDKIRGDYDVQSVTIDFDKLL